MYQYYGLKRKYKRTLRESKNIVYADDYVSCFQYKEEAEKYYQKSLPERLKKFKLELEPSKTRLIEFGRFAEENSKRRGQRRAKTFNFLGFTLYCSKGKRGYF